MKNQTIAVLLPCYNEAGAVGKTVADFLRALPSATVYVYDNNSTDGTVKEALQAGAVVRHEYRQGKGEVVRRMFSTLINKGFNAQLNDVFSGYRVMSRRFVKTVPIFSDGFQIETELTVHALHHNMSIKEVPTHYHSRPEGTASKLNTLSDGIKILNFILFLLRDVKPMFFFGALSVFLCFISLGLGIPVIIDFIDTGLVERVPTAILSSSIALIAVMSFFCGLILDNVSRGRREMRILSILRSHDHKPPQ